jgi:hypothetical protein
MAQKKLYSLIERVFEDGVVHPDERCALRTLYAEAGLNVSEVKAVFRTFLVHTWGEIIADGVLTPEERGKLANIAGELRLPLDCVPTDVALVLALGFA